MQPMSTATGTVNIQDLVQVAGQLGTSASAPAALYGGLRVAPTRAEVEQWLAQAQQLNLTDATSQRGIRFLEQLLLALTPKETMLLANYPNPFNPETWIPYQLANTADVTLHIYAVDGTLVRTLSLGHKAVGTYQNRSRAAVLGRQKRSRREPVASGIYFYTFHGRFHRHTKNADTQVEDWGRWKDGRVVKIFAPSFPLLLFHSQKSRIIRCNPRFSQKCCVPRKNSV